jgi:hypothetical protein
VTPVLFRRKTPKRPEPVAVDAIRVTLTLEALDPVEGPVEWTAVEVAKERTEDALEVALTALITKALTEAVDE